LDCLLGHGSGNAPGCMEKQGPVEQGGLEWRGGSLSIERKTRRGKEVIRAKAELGRRGKRISVAPDGCRGRKGGEPGKERTNSAVWIGPSHVLTWGAWGEGS